MARETTKKSGTAVANWDEELAKQAQVAAAVEANTGSGQFFSVRGGILQFDGAPLPGNQAAVVIVDSIIGLYRTEFAGRAELAERQTKLGAHIRDLVKLAAEFNLAVLVTNQVTADPGNMFVPDAKKPVGGNLLAHYVHVRVQLRKVCPRRAPTRRPHPPGHPLTPLSTCLNRTGQGHAAHREDLRGPAARGRGDLLHQRAGHRRRGVRSRARARTRALVWFCR